jgi:hypothetical protein
MSGALFVLGWVLGVLPKLFGIKERGAAEESSLEA